MEHDKTGPGVKFPPPLVFILFMLAAYALSQIFPLGIGGNNALRAIGIALTVLGFLLIFSAVYSFKRARTHLKPWKPSSTIVQSGVFAFSRHPIYLAFCFISVGIGLVLNSLWIVASTLPAIVVVFFIAVKKEEQYLENKFGAEYLIYKAKVRRWL